MIICGVDPGQKGGLAFITEDACSASPMPVSGKEIDGHALAQILRETVPGLLVIEKVGVMPKQGISSAFTFGKGVGVILGVCEAFCIPYRMVTPQAWKKVVLAGTAKDKDAATNFVRRAFPEIDLTPGRMRKPHDGMADAVCLAEYGRLEIAK